MSGASAGGTGSPMPTGNGFVGQAWHMSDATEFNAMAFMMRQIIEGKAFAAMVEVMSVSSSGQIAPAGNVSVKPMVNQVDKFGNQIPHGTIYNLPYSRVQGGLNAIIMDPAVGDIGVAVICDRDISNVKTTLAAGGPGSFRRNDWADGCLLGWFLNATPTQYIVFNANGIGIVSPTALTITAPNVTLDNSGNMKIKGAFIENATSLGGSGQVGGSTHTHPDPQGGNTGPPNPNT